MCDHYAERRACEGIQPHRDVEIAERYLSLIHISVIGNLQHVAGLCTLRQLARFNGEKRLVLVFADRVNTVKSVDIKLILLILNRKASTYKRNPSLLTYFIANGSDNRKAELKMVSNHLNKYL